MLTTELTCKIENQGETLLNPDVAYIQEVLSAFTPETLSLVMFKPGTFSLDGDKPQVQILIEGLITSSNLNILAATTQVLDKKKLHSLYWKLFDPSIYPVSNDLAIAQTKLNSYMVNMGVLSYIITGEQASQKMDLIKRFFRGALGFEKESGEVNNYIHVPDQEEVCEHIQLLFL